MTRALLLLALLVSLAAVGGPTEARRTKVGASHASPPGACGCHEGGPVCEDFWKTPVVFLGRVAAIVPLSQPALSSAHERIEFQVLEAFRGTSAARIELFNYSTTCHHGFTEREEWMVYAFPRHDGPGLTTYTCSRTRRRSESGVDLLYARAACAKTAEKGLRLGTVTYRTGTGAKSVDEPLAGVKVTARQQLSPEAPSGLTNRDGRVELIAEPGLYTVIAEPPPGWCIPYNRSVVQLLDARGCAATAFDAERSRNQSRGPDAAR